MLRFTKLYNHENKIQTYNFYRYYLFIFFIAAVFSQKTTDARKAESDGYFIHPVNTTAGVVATDNYASKIYLVQNNGLKTLVSSPGCGRYFTVSPDKAKIGFKLISTMACRFLPFTTLQRQYY